MARNEEKAQSTLARFRAAKAVEEGRVPQERPWDSSECTNAKEAEKWRFQIIKQIAKKVTQIQNAGLGEFRIRDLNDEINRLLREKRHWEFRIKELGGGDYTMSGINVAGADGQEVPGHRGYKYFGAAKDLPGVRELFETEIVTAKKKTRGELSHHIDADYFGYRDEDDGVILDLEKQAEEEAQQEAHRYWVEHGESKAPVGVSFQVETATLAGGGTDEVSPMEVESKETGGQQQQIIIPSQDEIAALLLQRQKKLLLEKYASESLQADQQETKQMSGRA
eukprot:m.16375 g.16375  ORF g.16375 m.16375 type:complete len:280 (-) comp5245_c0_seq1:90-929(-)